MAFINVYSGGIIISMLKSIKDHGETQFINMEKRFLQGLFVNLHLLVNSINDNQIKQCKKSTTYT